MTRAIRRLFAWLAAAVLAPAGCHAQGTGAARKDARAAEPRDAWSGNSVEFVLDDGLSGVTAEVFLSYSGTRIPVRKFPATFEVADNSAVTISATKPDYEPFWKQVDFNSDHLKHVVHVKLQRASALGWFGVVASELPQDPGLSPVRLPKADGKPAEPAFEYVFQPRASGHHPGWPTQVLTIDVEGNVWRSERGFAAHAALCKRPGERLSFTSGELPPARQVGTIAADTLSAMRQLLRSVHGKPTLWGHRTRFRRHDPGSPGVYAAVAFRGRGALRERIELASDGDDRYSIPHAAPLLAWLVAVERWSPTRYPAWGLVAIHSVASAALVLDGRSFGVPPLDKRCVPTGDHILEASGGGIHTRLRFHVAVEEPVVLQLLRQPGRWQLENRGPGPLPPVEPSPITWDRKRQ